MQLPDPKRMNVMGMVASAVTISPTPKLRAVRKDVSVLDNGYLSRMSIDMYQLVCLQDVEILPILGELVAL